MTKHITPALIRTLNTGIGKKISTLRKEANKVNSSHFILMQKSNSVLNK